MRSTKMVAMVLGTNIVAKEWGSCGRSAFRPIPRYSLALYGPLNRPHAVARGSALFRNAGEKPCGKGPVGSYIDDSAPVTTAGRRSRQRCVPASLWVATGTLRALSRAGAGRSAWVEVTGLAPPGVDFGNSPFEAPQGRFPG